MGKTSGNANEGKIWNGAGVLLFWVVVVLFYLATALFLGAKVVSMDPRLENQSLDSTAFE